VGRASAQTREGPGLKVLHAPPIVVLHARGEEVVRWKKVGVDRSWRGPVSSKDPDREPDQEGGPSQRGGYAQRDDHDAKYR
jgi:hypothetical protein